MTDIPEKFSTLFTDTILKIRPTEDELLKFDKINRFLSHRILASKIPMNIQIDFLQAEGSTGIKQTALRNAADIDFFIALNPKIIEIQPFNSKKARREFLRHLFKELNQNWLIPVMHSAGLENLSLSYAEHPYLSAKYQGIDLDIVLCFNISSEYLVKNGPITAVDRSPHHSRFIREVLTDDQKDEVRLLKAIFKANHCYGDKSAVGRTGFIGYSAELLIAHYGSIWSLLNGFGELENKIIANNHSLESNPFSIKTKSISEVRENHYPNDFLIILDPTDPKRNVGSSISRRAFYCLQDRISHFLSSPSKNFFETTPLPSIFNLPLQEKETRSIFYVDLSISEEDHYTKFRDKLYSLMDKFIQVASKEDTTEPRFLNVIGELFFKESEGRYCLAFSCPKPILSKTFARKGPHIGEEPHYSKFKDKHPEVKEVDGTLWLDLPRKYWSFKALLTDFFTQNHIKKLKVIDIGGYGNKDCSHLAQQNMANLYLNILPFQEKFTIVPGTYRQGQRSKRKKRNRK